MGPTAVRKVLRKRLAYYSGLLPERISAGLPHKRIPDEIAATAMLLNEYASKEPTDPRGSYSVDVPPLESAKAARVIDRQITYLSGIIPLLAAANKAVGYQRAELEALTIALEWYEQRHPLRRTEVEMLVRRGQYEGACQGCRFPGDEHKATCKLAEK